MIGERLAQNNEMSPVNRSSLKDNVSKSDSKGKSPFCPISKDRSISKYEPLPK